MRHELLEERLTYSVIGAFYESYNHLGFGFLESLCVQALVIELKARGHEVAAEVEIPVFYKEHLLGNQRIDVVVNGQVIVEVKSTRELPPRAKRQVYNYLRATRLQVGLLLHYGPEPCAYRVIHRPSHSHIGQIRSIP